jgi:four helix bundle protein
MGTFSKFEDIEAWKTAREMTKLVYTLSQNGSLAGDFGLRDQMRRASVSVMSNIAEGFESKTKALFIEFLGRAKGSAGELRSQIYTSLDVGYLDQEQYRMLYDLSDKCIRQISNLMRYLKR